jgi:hypothetical protein
VRWQVEGGGGSSRRGYGSFEVGGRRWRGRWRWRSLCRKQSRGCRAEQSRAERADVLLRVSTAVLPSRSVLRSSTVPQGFAGERGSQRFSHARRGSATRSAHSADPLAGTEYGDDPSLFFHPATCELKLELLPKCARLGTTELAAPAAPAATPAEHA